MKRSVCGAMFVLVLLAPIPRAAPASAEQNWINYTRIGAYGLRSDNADQIVRSAQEDGVSGIEVDNDIPGRYESFVNPEEKLRAIRAVAEKAHAAGNRAFVYIAGTECITANADKTPHTLAKDLHGSSETDCSHGHRWNLRGHSLLDDALRWLGGHLGELRRLHRGSVSEANRFGREEGPEGGRLFGPQFSQADELQNSNHHRLHAGD